MDFCGNVSGLFGVITIVGHTQMLFPTQYTDSCLLRSLIWILFFSSLFFIVKFAKAIPELHAALYSLSALDFVTGPVTLVQL